MDSINIINPWVVVDYCNGRPPHIYKIVKELENSIDVVCCDKDDSVFERLDNCHDRFSTVGDAVKNIVRKDGYKVENFVGEYAILFSAEKDNLVKLL